MLARSVDIDIYMTKKLSAGQIEILTWMRFHKGKANIGVQAKNQNLNRESAKALEKLGLIKCVGASHWVHGVGNTVVYMITEEGKNLLRIGNMFQAFHK